MKAAGSPPRGQALLLLAFANAVTMWMPAFGIALVAAAIVLGCALEAPLPSDGRLAVVIGIALLGGFFALGDRLHRGLLIAAAIALVIGWGDASVQRAGQPTIVEQPTARYAGTVIGDDRDDPDGNASYSFAIDNGPTVTVNEHGIAPASGTRLLLRGRIEPFDDGRNPGEPSERDIERERGIIARLASAHVMATLPDRGFDWRFLAEGIDLHADVQLCVNFIDTHLSSRPAALE